MRCLGAVDQHQNALPAVNFVPHWLQPVPHYSRRRRACSFWPWQVPLHPKSVYEVPGVWHGASELSGWAGHPDLLARAEAREEVADRIRFFAEDCDSLQVMEMSQA